MKILLCVEFFYPSVGGAQEVVKQIATRLVKRGHHVTVATSQLRERNQCELEGVVIAEFAVEGNLVRGIHGNVEEYRDFVIGGAYDAVFIYAAQQWTLDALLGCLPAIKARKILVPCGFSGLYLQKYKGYFERLTNELKCFDSLIFHSKTYRDFDFATRLGLNNCVVIPNGASEIEFGVLPNKTDFRCANSISSDAQLILTVGSISGGKGHLEVAKAVALCKSKREIYLVLNGNQMPKPVNTISHRVLSVLRRLRSGSLLRLPRLIARSLLKIAGFRKSYVQELGSIVNKINKGKYGRNKRVLIVDLPRPELIKCYFEADLFVFASMIEYSPLVLFESAAAGLPFLTVTVGNSEEIALWTGAGKLCPSTVDLNGYTRVDPAVLALQIDEMLLNDDARNILGAEGRKKWQNHFTWNQLVDKYEQILMGNVSVNDVGVNPIE